MPRISKHSIVVAESVVFEFLDLCRRRFPKESFGFLIGWPIDDRDIHRVDYCYAPRQRATAKHWRWTATDYARAQNLAAAKRQSIIGVIHSHCYPHAIPINGTQHSHADAEHQHNFSMALSAVAAIGPDGFALDVWRLGFTASMNVYIKRGRRIVTWDMWVKK